MKLKGWDSMTCRACHKNTKPPGASAKAAHGENGNVRRNLYRLNQNLVHKKVPEHDLNASLAQGKMVLKEEKKEKD